MALNPSQVPRSLSSPSSPEHQLHVSRGLSVISTCTSNGPVQNRTLYFHPQNYISLGLDSRPSHPTPKPSANAISSPSKHKHTQHLPALQVASQPPTLAWIITAAACGLADSLLAPDPQRPQRPASVYITACHYPAISKGFPQHRASSPDSSSLLMVQNSPPTTTHILSHLRVSVLAASAHDAFPQLSYHSVQMGRP